MKRPKVWMLWGFALLIFSLGYLGFHSLASSENVQGSESNSVSDSSKEVQVTMQTPSKPEMKSKKTTQTEQPETASVTGEGVTVIGDSVLVGVEPYLKEMLPKVTVDGKVGRQMSQAKKLTDELRKQGKLGDHIIIELGTNGPFSKDQLRGLLSSLSDVNQILVVTTRVPKGWQDSVNSNIKDVVSEFDNVHVVDWYEASEGKEDYFYKDGVHLKPDGSKFYASLLIQGLKGN